MSQFSSGLWQLSGWGFMLLELVLQPMCLQAAVSGLIYSFVLEHIKLGGQGDGSGQGKHQKGRMNGVNLTLYAWIKFSNNKNQTN